LDSGRFSATGSTVGTSEVMGALSVSGGSVMDLNANTGGLRLVFNSLARANNGTLDVRGPNLGADGTISTLALNTSNVFFTNPPTASLVGGGGLAGTTAVSILPFVVSNPSSSTDPTPTTFVTYDAAGVGIRPLNAAIANGSPGAEYRDVVGS